MALKHFLVPLDGSPLSTAVLPVVRILATVTGADVTLFTAVPPEPTHNVAQAVRDLAAMAQPLRAAGLTVFTTVRNGNPARAIADLAAECSADMILMATHSRTGLGRAVVGSVTDHVLRLSDVPLLLLHPDHHVLEAVRTIVVPVDGTPGGAVALMSAVPLARASGARLVLVRATVPLPLWLYDPPPGLDTGPLINPMWDEDARQSAEEYATRVAARLRHAGLTAEGRGVSGQPGAAISRLADEIDADLIVMSSHALEGPARSILGSVAGDIVRQSGRPVLVTRRSLLSTHQPLLTGS
jgi:nucleotide-binding universal stress UspA family protein